MVMVMIMGFPAHNIVSYHFATLSNVVNAPLFAAHFACRSNVAYLAEKFGGVSPGDCKTEGYSVFDHTETVSMGPLGDAEVTVYTKPASKAFMGTS